MEEGKSDKVFVPAGRAGKGGRTAQSRPWNSEAWTDCRQGSLSLPFVWGAEGGPLTLDPGARVGALTATAKVTLTPDTKFPKRLAFAVGGWNRESRNGAGKVTLCLMAHTVEERSTIM